MKCLENGNKNHLLLEIFRAHMFHILVILFLKVMTIRFAYQRQHFSVIPFKTRVRIRNNNEYLQPTALCHRKNS